jgi:hypothetical protein
MLSTNQNSFRTVKMPRANPRRKWAVSLSFPCKKTKFKNHILEREKYTTGPEYLSPNLKT